MPDISSMYRPRNPQRSQYYKFIQDHFERYEQALTVKEIVSFGIFTIDDYWVFPYHPFPVILGPQGPVSSQLSESTLSQQRPKHFFGNPISKGGQP